MDYIYLLSIKNIAKVFYKPAKVIPTLKIYWKAFWDEVQTNRDNKNDIKYKDVTDKFLVSVYENSLHALERLSNYTRTKLLEVESIEDVFGKGLEKNENCIKLGKLFTEYGSDKATSHNYHLIYYSILHIKATAELQILEIGLGSNNIDVMSNMGRYGKPGASLRAFRDYLPHANIYGADIDKRILFKENRIDTFFIDQTNIQILNSVKKSFGDKKFDLIIDDGLHNSEANLNSMEFALDLLSPNGILIIEDISEHDFIYYKLLASIFEKDYRIRFIKTKAVFVCYLTRVNSELI